MPRPIVQISFDLAAIKLAVKGAGTVRYFPTDLKASVLA
jgi:hypothetical protein